jgi:hypothetical protein
MEAPNKCRMARFLIHIIKCELTKAKRIQKMEKNEKMKKDQETANTKHAISYFFQETITQT